MRCCWSSPLFAFLFSGRNELLFPQVCQELVKEFRCAGRGACVGALEKCFDCVEHDGAEEAEPEGFGGAGHAFLGGGVAGRGQGAVVGHQPLHEQRARRAQVAHGGIEGATQPERRGDGARPVPQRCQHLVADGLGGGGGVLPNAAPQCAPLGAVDGVGGRGFGALTTLWLWLCLGLWRGRRVLSGGHGHVAWCAMGQMVWVVLMWRVCVVLRKWWVVAHRVVCLCAVWGPAEVWVRDWVCLGEQRAGGVGPLPVWGVQWRCALVHWVWCWGWRLCVGQWWVVCERRRIRRRGHVVTRDGGRV